MTPKEKAYDLIKKFNNEVIFTYRKVYFNTPVAEQYFSGISFECKEIPLKVVDEILALDIETTYNYINGTEHIVQLFVSYWNEVKEEIIKL